MIIIFKFNFYYIFITPHLAEVHTRCYSPALDGARCEKNRTKRRVMTGFFFIFAAHSPFFRFRGTAWKRQWRRTEHLRSTLHHDRVNNNQLRIIIVIMIISLLYTMTWTCLFRVYAIFFLCFFSIIKILYLGSVFPVFRGLLIRLI